MRLLLSLVFLAFIFTGSPARAEADRYEFDKSHTNLLFFVSHIGFSKMVGEFRDYSGYFTFDQEHPENSSVEVTLHPAGIETDSDGLNAHLQKEEFFNTEKYPDITFKSTAIKVTGANTGDITGDLTLLGVTKPVTLHVTFNKAGQHPATKNYVAGFSASAQIKRSEWGMTTYAPDIVGDDVTLMFEVEGINIAKNFEKAPAKN